MEWSLHGPGSFNISINDLWAMSAGTLSEQVVLLPLPKLAFHPIWFKLLDGGHLMPFKFIYVVIQSSLQLWYMCQDITTTISYLHCMHHCPSLTTTQHNSTNSSSFPIPSHLSHTLAIIGRHAQFHIRRCHWCKAAIVRFGAVQPVFWRT